MLGTAAIEEGENDPKAEEEQLLLWCGGELLMIIEVGEPGEPM